MNESMALKGRGFSRAAEAGTTQSLERATLYRPQLHQN
jgi:hypothetical protein